MRRAGKKIPSQSASREKCTVLAVSSTEEDVASLRDILPDDHFMVRYAPSCGEARRMMKRDTPAVIACEHALPDGTWRDLYNLAASLDDPPAIVVVSRHADEKLWAEVLNSGGYDVLAKPFEKFEVSRVIAMASRHGRPAAAP